MGVAKGQDNMLSVVNLTCEGNQISLSASTRQSGQKEDLEYFEGAKIILGYKSQEGFERKMGVDAKVDILAGNAFWVFATLSPDETAIIHKSISQGNRLDVQLVHSELLYDTDVKRVNWWGFNTALLAMHDLCPDLRENPSSRP